MSASCQQQSTVFITYGVHGLAGAYGGGWCVCGEHAAVLFQRLCAEMIRERPASEPTRIIYKPVEFTARAIVPDEGMMTTAVGRETRTTCQYKAGVDGPAQAEAPAGTRQAPDVERLTAAMTEAASAIGSLQTRQDQMNLDLDRLLNANNMNALMVASHNALSDRVARLEAAMEATALAWGTSE